MSWIWNWEEIDDQTSRLKVPGGWIVRTIVNSPPSSVHQIFVEDAHHEWLTVEWLQSIERKKE